MSADDVSFGDTWCVWYHYDTQTWSPRSFRLLTMIHSVSELWGAMSGLVDNPSLLMEHIYVMRKGVNPIWEDKSNRKGGCWSIKVDLRESFTVFVKILAYVMGERSLIDAEGQNLSLHTMGVSFCSKNSFNAIIQIWNDDKTLNRTTLLNRDIAEPFMAEIIYRPHIPEY